MLAIANALGLSEDQVGIAWAIVVGMPALILICCVALYWCYMSDRLKRRRKRNRGGLAGVMAGGRRQGRPLMATIGAPMKLDQQSTGLSDDTLFGVTPREPPRVAREELIRGAARADGTRGRSLKAVLSAAVAANTAASRPMGGAGYRGMHDDDSRAGSPGTPRTHKCMTTAI